MRHEPRYVCVMSCKALSSIVFLPARRCSAELISLRWGTLAHLSGASLSFYEIETCYHNDQHSGVTKESELATDILISSEHRNTDSEVRYPGWCSRYLRSWCYAFSAPRNHWVSVGVVAGESMRAGILCILLFIRFTSRT